MNCHSALELGVYSPTRTMFDPQLLTFTALVALLTITPGADTMLVLRSVLARGQKAGFYTTLGVCSGLFFHAALSALGVSLLLQRSAALFGTVKLAGAGYLIFLGAQSVWGAWRGNGRALAPLVSQTSSAPRPNGRSFLEGWLTNILNPKVAIFYLAFLPQFIRPTDPVLLKSLLLAGIHFTLGMVWLSLVNLFLGRLRGWLTRPSVQHRLEATTGLILIAFGVRLALERP